VSETLVHALLCIFDVLTLLYIMLLKGEYGTADAMTCEKLDQIFNKTLDEVIENGYLKNMLACFILTYGRCAANREHLTKLMKKEQRECFIQDPEEEKKNAFKCYCDFLTKSDLAFVRYHFDNSDSLTGNLREKTLRTRRSNMGARQSTLLA
jgi:predicted transposase YbfD/YdcC